MTTPGGQPAIPSARPAPINLGYVKYFNTLPLVEGLSTCADLSLHAAVPAKLGDMLARGEVDIALASLVDMARSSVPLTLIPAGMIGCDGPTLTVRIFSRVPMDRVRTLACDTDSHTSVILAQVILARVFQVRPLVRDFDARERVVLPSPAAAEGGTQGVEGDWPETMLLIGDKVVTDSPPAVRYPYQLDLGEEWKKLTDLSFVYAMWMCRSADVQPGAALRERLISVASLLDRQRRRNTARLDWIVQSYAHDRRWPEDLAERYVRQYLRYDPDTRAIGAVQRFLGEAAGLGLLPDAKVDLLKA